MDVDDRATELEEKFREIAIAAATRPLPSHVRESEAYCTNQACGIEIPKARREAMPGCDFCVDCQERRENALKRRFQCR
jgi:phage/conjugal plasmid C-4 type zinc finger TraR family protein